MFWHKDKEKAKEKRSLDDMFTPKEEDGVCDEEVVIEGDELAELAYEKEEVENKVVKPLDFFGMEEGKTDKWLTKCVKFWYCLMSFLWFLLGAVTFAPVLYISNKVNVIFKDKNKSLLCAVLIHAVFIALIFVFFTIR